MSDNTAPVLTTVAGSLNATLECSNAAGIAAAIAAAPSATDNCGSVHIHVVSDVTTPGSCPNNYTRVRVWNFTDDCSNTSSSFTQTISVSDHTAPMIACLSNQTRQTDPGQCYYTAFGSEFNPTSFSDNCSVPTISNNFNFTNTLAGAHFPRGITHVVWTATDACGNHTSCSFDVKVIDDQNSTNYIIFATSEAMFGENNYIGGDVGVSASNGKADFKKNDVLDPNTVFAKNITVQLPSSVNNRVFSPAINGPAATFMIYNGNTTGLSNVTVSSNITLNGPYKDVTVKKNVICTITGNNFGKITIEEGAKVTFTSSVINLEELNVSKGKKNVNTTFVYFTNPTSVKVKNKVTIEESSRVNVCGPKVTFYLGDSNPDEEKFTIKGDDVQVTANIMIPHGKLQIHGGDDGCIMTGWYIIEKLNSDGKNTTWNPYTCAVCSVPSGPSYVYIPEVKETPVVKEEPKPVESFKVTVFPNPSTSDFSIRVLSRSTEPIVVRVMDMNGVVKGVSNMISKGSTVKVGANLIGGTYMAEITQGKNRQVVKMVKVN